MKSLRGAASHRLTGTIAAGVLLMALAVGGAQAKGGGVKGGGAENVGGAGSGLVCTDGGEIGSAGLNRSGNRLSIAIGMANDAFGADWDLVVADNGVLASSSHIAYPGLNWSSAQVVPLAKGLHTIDITLTSAAGEICSGSASVKN